MTQNDKKLLIRDLCARLPYGIIVHLEYDENTSVTRELGIGSLHDIMMGNADGKPYLRPMSSMTEEEKIELTLSGCRIKGDGWNGWVQTIDTIDWLNAHHIDYRGLIPKGLAIAVTKENNPYKE